jgi:hypothetical protein
MNTTGFDIEAKAEGSSNRAQIWLMLKSLIDSRGPSGEWLSTFESLSPRSRRGGEPI